MKEREQASEKRRKDLENKVNELEGEYKGLRGENGLKGLFVSVTGGNPSSTIQADSNTSMNDSSRGKRKRDMERTRERWRVVDWNRRRAEPGILVVFLRMM